LDGQAIMTVSAAVVALTQLAKWAGVNDKLGPICVIILSIVGVMFWGYSEGSFQRTQTFEYFAGWIAVTTSAAGVFGFTRAASDAVVRARGPLPGSDHTGEFTGTGTGTGAGSDPTRKMRS
jgi:O-antigen/teichoic acid export membrane protein